MKKIKTCNVRCLVVGHTYFAVHANGEIYALHRRKNMPWNGPKLIVGTRTALGYQSFLVGGRNGPRRMMHREIAKLYIPNPENKRTINHKDGDKLNNCVSNLEWATHGENHRHAWKYLGRKAWLKGRKWSNACYISRGMTPPKNLED